VVSIFHIYQCRFFYIVKIMMQLRLILNLVLYSIFFISCSSGDKKSVSHPLIDEKIILKGYDLPSDSIAAPNIVPAGKPMIVRARRPIVVKEREHIRIGAGPNKFNVGVPKVCTPGQNGFAEPLRIAAKGITFLSDFPEVIVARSPSSKDVNQHGFSSFGTIQGLKTNQIRSMLQDRNGNLWFSSDDGITRYDGKYLSHFVVSNGTRRNSIILCMLEDRAGSLWFGTFGGGVLCFDGKKFTQYTEKEGLSNNIVNCIIQDNSGNYWMATSGGGISKFDGKEFTHYTTREGLSSNQIRALLQDKEGKIWIGTFGDGISQFDGSGFKNYSEKEGFPAFHIASILQDKEGNIWFGSFKHGLIKYDGRCFYQYTDKQGLSNNTVLCMMQENNGIFWLGTSGGGIFRFDGKIFENFNEEDGLTNNYIRCSLIGRQGNLWFGTRDGGLVRYNKNLFTHYTYNEGLAGNKILSMMQDRKGNDWFTSYGGGITRYDGKEFSTYSLKETQLNDYVYTILECANGDIWFGSDGGGITRFDGKNFFQYTQKEGLCHNSVRCMIEDRNHNIWIGSYGGGVSKFNGKEFVKYKIKEGLSGDKIMCILEDKNGNIWFGTDGGGVTKYDGKKFTHFILPHGLNSSTISSIIQDNKGVLWFGSSGGGALRYDGKYITMLTKKEGLGNNYVNSLLQDREGNLWIGTRIGPNVLESDQLQGNLERSKPLVFREFSYDDGFFDVGCNLNSLFQDKNGTVWIGTTNRLSAVRLKENVPDTVPPNIQLTNIRLFNENIPWMKINSNKDTSFILGNNVKVGDFRFSGISKWYFLPEDLSLAYNNNFLTFSFIGISQRQTSKIRYQYKLEGLDNYWSSITDLTEISYLNLKPGKYIFKVKAMNSEGIWSKENRYSFSIRYPWWKSLWFYSLILVGIVSLVVSIFKWRELEHELQTKLLNQKIEEQTFAMKEKNRELESKNKELQVSNSEKDRFFSIIAHDVRGPLSTFMLFTEVLSENLQSYNMDEIQGMAGSMKDSASSLYKLLENLLEWSRMQQGLIQFNPEQLNIIEVLTDSMETSRQFAKNKSIALVFEIPSELEVVADKNMLASVIRNLISNALKFTPQGGKVTIRAHKTAQNIVEISVTDTGIGMDEQMLGDLFRMDVHINRKGTDGESSVGLGLLLCKDFVEKQNGRIWAESIMDKGSTFYFTLEAVPRL